MVEHEPDHSVAEILSIEAPGLLDRQLVVSEDPLAVDQTGDGVALLPQPVAAFGTLLGCSKPDRSGLGVEADLDLSHPFPEHLDRGSGEDHQAASADGDSGNVSALGGGAFVEAESVGHGEPPLWASGAEVPAAPLGGGFYE